MNPNLAELIQNLLSTSREKEKAFAECDNNPSYFCHREIENERLAINALEEALNELIETKLTQMLKELRP